MNGDTHLQVSASTVGTPFPFIVALQACDVTVNELTLVTQYDRALALDS